MNSSLMKFTMRVKVFHNEDRRQHRLRHRMACKQSSKFFLFGRERDQSRDGAPLAD